MGELIVICITVVIIAVLICNTVEKINKKRVDDNPINKLFKNNKEE